MARKKGVELQLGKNKDIVVPFRIAWSRQPDMSIHEQRVLLRIMELCNLQLKGIRISDNLGQIEVDDNPATYEITMPVDEAFARNSTVKEVEQTLDTLSNRSFQYRDSEMWWKCHYIEHPKVHFGKGTMSFGVYKPFWEILQNFVSGFREIELNKALLLPTSYAVKFYMMMSGKSKPFFMTIDNLRQWLGLEEKAYRDKNGKTRLDNIERVIIKPSQKALDESCPWTFTYTKERENEKNPKSPVVKLWFTPVFQPQFRDPDLGITLANSGEDLKAQVEEILSKYFKVPQLTINMPGHQSNIDRWLQYEKAPLDWLRHIWSLSRKGGKDMSIYVLGAIKNRGLELAEKQSSIDGGFHGL